MSRDSDLFRSNEITDLIPGTSQQFWAELRHKGGGPPFVKIGRLVYYRRSDLEKWLADNTFTKTVAR